MVCSNRGGSRKSNVTVLIRRSKRQICNVHDLKLRKLDFHKYQDMMILCDET